ncbi:MAG TPA: alpha-amylase family protein [Actinomycetota bacterium]|nr:alpha-amylase family protein [Actinomycetota bacterium]
MSDPGWWESWPWRLVQTNLRETDMRDIDAEQYVDSLRAFDATVAMINTSGIIASYPTALPFHTQSAFLQGDDLASIVEACHAAGIKVIARTDFSKVRRRLFERHPEWAYRRADGEIVDDAEDVHVCITGGYQQEYAPRIVEETITVLDVDGIYFNMAGFQTQDYRGIDHGICHCAGCVEGFLEMSGLALPDAEDIDDPVYRRYVVFRERTMRSTKQRMDALVRRLRPDLAIDRPSDDVGGFVRQESNTALDRSPPEWQYSASANTKWVVGSLPRTVSSNSSVDFVDYPVRHVSVSSHRQRLRLAQTLANGGGLDYYVIGRLDGRADRSALDAVREVFGFHAAHEEEYRDLRSCAPVALLTGPHGNSEEFRGWFRILAEHQFLFDTLLIDAATEPVLAHYSALVIPDHQPISNDAASRLDRFVRVGGTLIASGRPGFRTEELEPRDAPALACLGIERIREVWDDVRGAYLELDDHCGFGRLHDTDLVFLDGPYVDAEYRPEAQRRLRLIPPGPFGPPERCVLPAATGEPGLVVHPFGAGLAVFVPWSCGALVERHGHPNTSSFLADVLQHHAGLEPLGGNLSPMVEVTLFEREAGTVHVVHLVNGSGNFGTSCVEPVTMHDLEVVLSYTGEPADVTALVAGRSLECRATGDRLTIHVPELRLFEAVRITRDANQREGK